MSDCRKCEMLETCYSDIAHNRNCQSFSLILDKINPAHYQGEIECIDAIRASMPAEQYRGYLKGNIIKYIWRYEHKGGVEDLEKAEWYIERLIKEAKK